MREYQVVGEEHVRPLGMTFNQGFFILHDIKNPDNVVRVFDGLNMGTTRDWATSEEMAISNKIKLLENEIVSLELRRQNGRKR